VFRAYDAAHERLVAVKLFTLDLPPDRVHQLVAEFEKLIAAELTHPAIAKPIATGMRGTFAYLVQDYIAGESLDQAIREYGPAPESDALRVAAQLAGALDFAAAVNVHHGALHPRDVLLSADDTRLTGIGVAAALERVGVAPPIRRPYSAPERVGGDTRRGSEGAKAGAPVDRRADIFGLAAVVYELLSGKRVAGTGEPATESLGTLAGADSAAVRSVFARALAENPTDRFATALEFVEALKQSSVMRQSTVDSRPSSDSRQSSDSRLSTVDSRQSTVDSPPSGLAFPIDSPESSDRADVELAAPIEVAQPDLPLAAAEAQRYEDVEVAPAIVADDVHVSTGSGRAIGDTLVVGREPVDRSNHEPFTPEQSRSVVWPIVLALVVGIAVGYAGGYSVGTRERSQFAAATAPPPAAAGREFTETPVKPEEKKPDTDVRLKPDSTNASPLPPAGTNANQPAKEQTSGVRLQADQPEPLPGRLLVRSTPAGARVTVDGRDAGVTPATVHNLADGSHLVRITRDGYAPEERRILISRGRPSQSLIVPLAAERVASATPATTGPFVGGLMVESRPPGAKVFLDGKLLGTTPLAQPVIPAGEHAIRLERDGYRRWSSSIRVVANEQNRVTASLER
jgi:serine/threonine protein kinase